MANIDPITELQRCMALVRPVGMSDSAVKDWLVAAVAEVQHIAPHTLALACSEVRKSASHHGQIVPGILKSQAVVNSAQHERMVRQLVADGHSIPGRNAPQIEHRGGARAIGQIKMIEAPR